MRISVALPTTGAGAAPDRIAAAATAAEEAGLARVWTVDRLLRPTGGDSPVGEHYRTTFDPLETLTWVAAQTTRIGLGVSIVIVPFQNVVVLAKRFATLDNLSGGRATVGLGLGHMEAEFRAAGVDKRERGPRLEEALQALRLIWGPDPVEFMGRFTRISAADIGPKPWRNTGVPMIIGGNARAALERAARFGLGINPLLSSAEKLAEQVALWGEATTAAGYDPSTLDVVVRTNIKVGEESADGVRRFGTWPRDSLIEDLRRLESIGVTEVFYELHDARASITECISELAAIHRAVGTDLDGPS